MMANQKAASRLANRQTATPNGSTASSRLVLNRPGTSSGTMSNSGVASKTNVAATSAVAPAPNSSAGSRLNRAAAVPQGQPASSRLSQNQSDQIPENNPKLSATKSGSFWKNFWPSKKHDAKPVFWLKILRFLALLAFIGVIAVIIVFFCFFFYFNSSLPNPANIVRQTGYSTKIYDRNGELLYDVYGDQRRDALQFDQIGGYLKQATVAIEDKDFYKHKGFDYLTVVRIPYYYLTQRRLVGGSTLTQQLVKNMLLTSEVSIERKFKELILSMQIESQFDKDQILQMYLNESPYGGNLYGVGAASRVYFNKPAAELNLAEAAVLAGLPQNPTQYSPFAGKTNSDGEYKWRARGLGVLRRMYEDNYINEAEYQQALLDIQEIDFERQASQIQAPHFVFYIKDILNELYGEDVAESGGLKVTTTLDLNLQNDVQTIVSEEVDAIEKMNVSNGSALVLNPQNGEILAMVGSKDYWNKEIGGEFNNTVDALRQPGSSIKPLTYLAYLQQGHTPATMIADVPTTFAANDAMDPYSPNSYDGKFRGPVSVRNALGNSLNVPAVKALANVGVENFLQLAYEAGLEDFEPTPANLRRFGLAVTLGGAETRMIDLASAYSAFANGGYKVEPVGILKIEDKNGKVIYQHQDVTGKQIFDPQNAYLITDILSDNKARTDAFGSNSKLNASPNIAVKTGTTNNLKDNWTIGWGQEFLVTTWVGNNDNKSMSGLVSGITGAAPIWRRIVDRMLELGYEASAFDMPEGVEEVEVDTISGYYKHDDFASKVEKVVMGTLPAGDDPIHIKAKVCPGENKLATDAQVAGGSFEEREYIQMREDDPVSEDGKNRWQEAIDRWTEGADSKYRYPHEYCGSSDEIFIAVMNLENEKVYNESKLSLRVKADAGDGIEKVELWIDGDKKAEANGNEMEKEFDLGSNRHEVWAKAVSRSGKVQESPHYKIGTGGTDWKSD